MYSTMNVAASNNMVAGPATELELQAVMTASSSIST